jgi:hypothetical protein
VSHIRFEKPHSLSYHAATRTSLPSIAFVAFRSTVELAGLWLKSIETSGSSVQARMPLSGPLDAAALIASLISCALVSRPGHEGEVDEAHVLGGHADRDAVELALQLREHEAHGLGGTVEVGIIEQVAARAR